jgi:hypothetical protein
VNCSVGVAEAMAISWRPMAKQASSHRNFETPQSWRSQSAASTISHQVGVAIGKIGPQERGQVGPPIRQGLSLVRLAEALGVSQPAAWRVGHALQLLVTREQQFGGTVEMDELSVGGRPRNCPRLGSVNFPSLRKGHVRNDG